MKNLIFLSLLLTIYSCGENNDSVVDANFKFPIIQQPTTSDTVEYFQANYITGVHPVFLGKSSFCDTLNVTFHGHLDSMYNDDFMNTYAVWNSDSMKFDGFELFPDYNSTVANFRDNEWKGKCYYPVYAANQTPSIKTFTGKDHYVYAIQEALDSNLDWQPIEAHGHDFCGHGNWGLKIYPNEFVAFLMPKYQGDFKTKLRVRLVVNYNLYVSAPFEGTINYNQFYLDRDEGYYYSLLVEDRASTIQYSFYGAEPKEVDYENFGR